MLEEDFGSDTDDDDYVPDGEANQHLSEEEGSGDEEKIDNDGKANISGKRRKGKQEKFSTFSRNADSQAKQDWQKYEEEIQKEKKSVDEEARIDSLWSAFKSDVQPKAKPVSKQCTSSSEALSTSSTTSTSTTTSTKPPSSGGSRFSSLFDPSPSPTQTKKQEPAVAKSRFGSLFDTDKDSSNEKDNSDVTTSDKQSNNSDKVAITKVYDFAGEMVKVTKQVDANSKEAKKFKENEIGAENAESTNSEETVSGKRKAGGLASIVGNITGKKTKMGCLDKSKLDWNQFTEEEGIKEELASFNRGKDGFVEKQMFLERADQRQFQIEKAIRDKNRKSFMK